jgi:hypothetical protein
LPWDRACLHEFHIVSGRTTYFHNAFATIRTLRKYVFVLSHFETCFGEARLEKYRAILSLESRPVINKSRALFVSGFTRMVAIAESEIPSQTHTRLLCKYNMVRMTVVLSRLDILYMSISPWQVDSCATGSLDSTLVDVKPTQGHSDPHANSHAPILVNIMLVVSGPTVVSSTCGVCVSR